MARPIPSDIEKRDALAIGADGEVAFRAPQVRAAGDSLGPGYDGYPVIWNTADSYATFFTRGATRKSVNERIAEIPVLYQHDSWQVIGRHTEMKEDKTGLFVRAVISDTTIGRDVMTLLRDGVPLGLSFGFQTVKDRSATDEDDIDLSVAPDWVKGLKRNELRAITEVRYWEDSPVTFASNPKAKPGDVRAELESLLPQFRNSIEAGTLTAEDIREIEQSIAAWKAVAGAGSSTPLPDLTARRANDLRIFLALAESQGLFTGVA